MTLATALAELKASLDQGNEALTTKHFRLLVEALESVTFGNFLTLGTPESLTIASGAITVSQSFAAVDTEASAASDDLDTIVGGNDGSLLMLRASSSSRDIVIRDVATSGGNIYLDGAVSFTFTHARDRMLLTRNDVGDWLELCRSNNL